MKHFIILKFFKCKKKKNGLKAKYVEIIQRKMIIYLSTC